MVNGFMDNGWDVITVMMSYARSPTTVPFCLPSLRLTKLASYNRLLESRSHGSRSVTKCTTPYKRWHIMINHGMLHPCIYRGSTMCLHSLTHSFSTVAEDVGLIPFIFLGMAWSHNLVHGPRDHQAPNSLPFFLLTCFQGGHSSSLTTATVLTAAKWDKNCYWSWGDHGKSWVVAIYHWNPRVSLGQTMVNQLGTNDDRCWFFPSLNGDFTGIQIVWDP